MSAASVHLFHCDAMDAYAAWPVPTCIVSDGPYGIGGYPGDPATPDALPAIYDKHAEAWAAKATPETTLWFWNTELGWALSHPVLARHGWEYRGCNIWNKGVGHIAGNCNGLTMRKFPVVTEVCAHYVRKAAFVGPHGEPLDMQGWLRAEWKRTGLPFSRANEACGVKNAATRKYLTPDHLFYAPPPDVFRMLHDYANRHGQPSGRPYFDLGESDGSGHEGFDLVRSKFNFEYGATNVWDAPANRGRERLKANGRAVHGNQKPEALIKRVVAASTDPGDVVWDPFCGTGAVALTAARMGRIAYTAEIDPALADLVRGRIAAAPQLLEAG